MNHNEERRTSYLKNWEQFHASKTLNHAVLDRMGIEAQARLNRMLLSKGAIAVWWDEETVQYKLRDAYVPTRLLKNVERQFADDSTGQILRKIAIKLDEHGRGYFPDISSEESTFGAALRVQAKAIQRLNGYSDIIRTLKRQELKWWLHFHGIALGADEKHLYSSVSS